MKGPSGGPFAFRGPGGRGAGVMGRTGRRCDGVPGMAPPPPNGRRPIVAAVAIVLVVGLVILFIVAM